MHAHFEKLSFPTSIVLSMTDIGDPPRVEIDFSRPVAGAIMPKYRSKDGREWYVVWPDIIPAQP